jgi:hypothetical protein
VSLWSNMELLLTITLWCLSETRKSVKGGPPSDLHSIVSSFICGFNGNSRARTLFRLLRVKRKLFRLGSAVRIHSDFTCFHTSHAICAIPTSA